MSTITKNGSTELTEYHPDRLETNLITAKEHGTLPYGTVLTSEAIAKTNQKLTTLWIN